MDYHKIYVIIYFIGTGKAICLDRAYDFLTEDKAVWGKVCFGDIIEVSRSFCIGRNMPVWTDGLTEHMSFWTNYYE